MAAPENTQLAQGDIFALGWFYDREETHFVMRATKPFDLKDISLQLIAKYLPKTKVTVSGHIQLLRNELLMRKLAVPVNLRHFCHGADGSDRISNLDTEGFYRGD